MSIKTIYKTTDGKEFDTHELAVAHEHNIENLKKEITEDISKILLKLQNLKRVNVENDGDGYYIISNEKELENKYLCSLKTLLEDISKNEYNLESYLTQYYNSNCY